MINFFYKLSPYTVFIFVTLIANIVICGCKENMWGMLGWLVALIHKVQIEMLTQSKTKL